MSDLSQVTQQAFREELTNWQMTLQRESKKLKQLRKSINNKFQINSIDITLIEMQSELILYKKTKQKKYADNNKLIEDYTSLSKRFINIMEKIGEAVDRDHYKDTHIPDIFTENPQENQNINVKRNIHEQSLQNRPKKETIRKKNSSMIETKKDLFQLLRQKQRSSTKKNVNCGRRRSDKPSQLLSRLQLEEQQDLSDVRYQLRQIKSMMVQIQNQIKFHNHEQVEREISKLAHNNKKITAQIKSLKEDNQFIQARLQNVKEEINHEKNIQAEMIKQFQLGKQNKAFIAQLSKSKNLTQEVSDWVKVRI